MKQITTVKYSTGNSHAQQAEEKFLLRDIHIEAHNLKLCPKKCLLGYEKAQGDRKIWWDKADKKRLANLLVYIKSNLPKVDVPSAEADWKVTYKKEVPGYSCGEGLQFVLLEKLIKK